MSTSINFRVEKQRHGWTRITFILGDEQGKQASRSVVVPNDRIAATMESIMTSVDPSVEVTTLAAMIANGITNQGVGRSGFTLRISH